MKLSELIKELTSIHDEYGDLDATMSVSEEQYYDQFLFALCEDDMGAVVEVSLFPDGIIDFESYEYEN
jgi:hypothetical protein